MDGLTERQRLEQLLRERVIQARQRYECTRRACGQIAGAPAQCLNQSGALESEALAEYADALGAFADLVLRGRRP